jgi:glycogen debranching enzyme
VSERRRTPLDPYPEPRKVEREADEKAYPPELGTDAIAILEGRTFMFSDARGDVPAGSVGGLLHDDTRFVSRWELTLRGEPLSVLKSAAADYYTASFFLTNPELPGLRAQTVTVRRTRFIGNGMVEQIGVFNSSPDPVDMNLRLACGADYADLFEVKSAVRDRSDRIRCEEGATSLRFAYHAPGFAVQTEIDVVRSALFEGAAERVVRFLDAEVDDESFVWSLELPGRHLVVTLLTVGVRLNDRVLTPPHEVFAPPREPIEGPLTDWLEAVPQFESSSYLLTNTLAQSVRDLAALRISGELRGERYVLPAAGLPWFMTLFGRDTLITSLQTLWVGPQLARGALHLLGDLQGTRVDAFRDEEPGKILHEVRSGELTVSGEKPHSPYYGTADATPLWLIVLSELWRWSGDDAFARTLWPSALAALSWLDRYGDRDGDGYVEYMTASSQGLGNQCWKDSWDGIQFADGSIPYLPLATAEIQGYVYDAKLRMAELARRLHGDEALAGRLEGEAAALRERFDADFWTEARGGYYVVALDRDKQQVDSLTSNMGHLLWSGIVPAGRAEVIARHLLSNRIWSGWGVRTMSRQDTGYNPIGYHTGTVWPHDNAIIALGLVRYGLREEANRIAVAQLEAASFSGFRLPEAFAGYERWISPFPVPYPTACSPQAWATGAPFSLVQALLGLEAHEGSLRIDPMVPERLGRIAIRRLHALGTTWDVEAEGDAGDVRPSDG